MTDPEDQDVEAVDRLVRTHLDRVTEQTDATKLHARIRVGLQEPARPGVAPGRRWSRALGWSTAAAAMVIGAFLGGRSLNPATVDAATILHQVRVTHAQGVDRCYRVHYAPDPRYWDGTKRLEGPSESVLWTRGDRFWADCSIGDIRLVLGREADGTFWVSPSRSKGIRFVDAESQWPEELAALCDINSLTVPVLVDDVLADFDLRAEGPSAHAGEATSLVWARLKPGRSHPLLAAVLLEIDARSDLLRRLVLWTVRDGRPNGTVTYTLLQSAPRGEEQYRLESHLDPGAAIEIHHFRRGQADGSTAGG